MQAACVSALLFLGLLNPVFGNRWDTAIGFFIFGFGAFFVLKSPSRFLSLILVGIALVIFAVAKKFELASLYGSILGISLGFCLLRLKLLEKSGIWVVIAAFCLSAIVTGGQLRRFVSLDLQLNTYNNDPGVFLKTYLLLEQNFNYYDAYSTAFLGRFEQSFVPRDIWGWRLPTIFWIWKLLPGSSGINIYLLFIVLCSFLLYVAYKIGKIYLKDSYGLLSAYLLFPYLHFAARDQMFLETEWWSVAFFIFGIYFLLIKKIVWATFLFIMTVLTREVYILPLGLMMVYFFFKKNYWPIFVIPLLSFLAIFLLHVRVVNLYIDAWGTLLAPRVVSNGFLFLQQTLAFGSWEYLLFEIRPLAIFLLAATLGCVHLFFKKRDQAIILILAFLPFPLSFLRFGTLPYNDYWGIIFAPIVCILAPLSLRLWQAKIR